MNQACVARLLCAVACIGAAAAVEDAVYTKIADLSIDGLTEDILSARAVISVLLDSDAAPEIDYSNHVQWTHGKTKVDLEVDWGTALSDWSTDGASKWNQARFQFSTKTCDDPDASSAINVYPADPSAEFRWQLSQPLADPQEGSQGGTKMTYSLVKNLVISLPFAPCAAIVLDSEELAKVDVVPSPPVFPESFYAGIESTHVKDGFSRYGSEAYSHLCDAVSFAFYNSEAGFKRVIGDYKNQKVWHISSPNATYASGVCWSEDMSNRPEFIEGENGGLVSSAKFLGFINQGNNEATYVPDGEQTIRGVPTEQWAYKKLIAGPGKTEERLTVKLFFSSPEWHFAKSTGHRILQRVKVSGHTDDVVHNTSTPVENIYDYIDFRAFLPPWAGFEPCEIMPGGDGCECLELGCVDDGAASNGVVTRFASPAACEALGLAAGSETSGSSSNRQKRNLMLVWFFGVFVGALLAAGGAYLAHRCFMRKNSQNFKDTEVIDQPPQRVFGALQPTASSEQYAVDQQ